MKKKVYIRADGSPEIGLGHLVRCIALAEMLADYFEVTFFCWHIPENLQLQLTAEGFGLKFIPNESFFIGQLSGEETVVLDGYHFQEGLQQSIRKKGCKLAYIDDLHEKPFHADLIINHAPGVHASDYKAQPYTHYALGPEYALLRSTFLNQAREKRKVKQVKTAFICFGGSDIKNLTKEVLLIVSSFKIFEKIIVVTGSGYMLLNTLEPLLAADRRISHSHSVSESGMLELMLETDLAIVPSSGILFEALATGCKIISGYYVNNQLDIYKGFLSMGAFLDAKNFNEEDLINCLSRIDELPNLHPIDGQSKLRLLKEFESLQNIHSNLN